MTQTMSRAGRLLYVRYRPQKASYCFLMDPNEVEPRTDIFLHDTEIHGGPPKMGDAITAHVREADGKRTAVAATYIDRLACDLRDDVNMFREEIAKIQARLVALESIMSGRTTSPTTLPSLPAPSSSSLPPSLSIPPSTLPPGLEISQGQ